jgi:hypothetical protein
MEHQFCALVQCFTRDPSPKTIVLCEVPNHMGCQRKQFLLCEPMFDVSNNIHILKIDVLYDIPIHIGHQFCVIFRCLKRDPSPKFDVQYDIPNRIGYHFLFILLALPRKARICVENHYRV